MKLEVHCMSYIDNKTARDLKVFSTPVSALDFLKECQRVDQTLRYILEFGLIISYLFEWLMYTTIYILTNLKCTYALP